MLFVQTCTEYFQVLGDAISLSPLQEFALSVKCLLKFYGIISLSNFEILFHEYYGIEVRPALYNFLNACSMLQSISNVAVIKGEVNKYICLVEDRNGKCVNFFFFFFKLFVNSTKPKCRQVWYPVSRGTGGILPLKWSAFSVNSQPRGSLVILKR